MAQGIANNQEISLDRLRDNAKPGKFKIKFIGEKAEIFREVIQTLANLTDEFEIKIDNSIEVKFREFSLICLGILSIDGKNADEFEQDIPLIFGTNADDLDKILRSLEVIDAIELKKEANDRHYSIILWENGEEYYFTLGFLEFNEEYLPLENLRKIQWPVKFSIPIHRFQKILKCGEIYGEVINVVANQDKIDFSTKGHIGTFTGKIKTSLDKDTSEASNYSLQFLLSLCRSLKGELFNDAEIHLGTDLPLRVLISSILAFCKIEYFLAPRVEEVEYDEEDDL